MANNVEINQKEIQKFIARIENKDTRQAVYAWLAGMFFERPAGLRLAAELIESSGVAFDAAYLKIFIGKAPDAQALKDILQAWCSNPENKPDANLRGEISHRLQHLGKDVAEFYIEIISSEKNRLSSEFISNVIQDFPNSESTQRKRLTEAWLKNFSAVISSEDMVTVTRYVDDSVKTEYYSAYLDASSKNISTRSIMVLVKSFTYDSNRLEFAKEGITKLGRKISPAAVSGIIATFFETRRFGSQVIEQVISERKVDFPQLVQIALLDTDAFRVHSTCVK